MVRAAQASPEQRARFWGHIVSRTCGGQIYMISPPKRKTPFANKFTVLYHPAPHDVTRDARARRDTRTRHERIHAKHSEPTLAQSCRHLTAACALALTALALAVLALAGPVCTVYQIRAILPTPRLQT